MNTSIEEFDKLKKARQDWLTSAFIYYIKPGDDTGMSDHQWDAIGKELYNNKDKFPDCPILNDPTYNGGSLFWVNMSLYRKVFALNIDYK